jgi:hypothetical protein
VPGLTSRRLVYWDKDGESRTGATLLHHTSDTSDCTAMEPSFRSQGTQACSINASAVTIIFLCSLGVSSVFHYQEALWAEHFQSTFDRFCHATFDQFMPLFMVCHLHGTVVPESMIIGTDGWRRFISLDIAVAVSRPRRWSVTTRSKFPDLKSAKASDTVAAADTEYP